MTENEKKFNELLLNLIKNMVIKMAKLLKNEEPKETTREFDFDDEMIKRVIILNPSKEAAALERFFNSFLKLLGEEKGMWEIK